MKQSRIWIWQHPKWPSFSWDVDAIAPLLRACTRTQGQLVGMMGASGTGANVERELDALLQNVITSSAIEGEQLNVGSLRSSLAKRLGLTCDERVTARSEGLAELMLDAIQQHDAPLTFERLMHWHRLLLPEPSALTTYPIRVGMLRGPEPMQVVSGRIDRPVVHFEAPAREGLEQKLDGFFYWFNSSRVDPTLDPLIRAGIAHLWFVTLHPFDDGNGRLARAITDLAMAQGEHQAIRFYAMSASILVRPQDYYRILERTQRGDLNITEWLVWFLQTLLHTLELAIQRIERVLAKAGFWQAHRDDGLSPEQTKVLNRLLNGDLLSEKPDAGFTGGISAAQYQAVAKVSKATATRHLHDLVEKSCLLKLPGGGRSTRYQINWPA